MCRRDDVAVVPADAKSIATSPAWRNPDVESLRLRAGLRTLCRRTARALRWVGFEWLNCVLCGVGSPNPAPVAIKVATSHSPRTQSLYPPLPRNDPLSAELAGYVAAYQRSGDLGRLLDELRAYAERTDAVFLAAAAKPFQGMPEVVIPLYERITAERSGDAQAMVI